jgi:hypothetical protein
MFVQVNSNMREMYVGICEGSALKTHFQIVHFNYTPPQYSHLSGLLEIFKSKLVNIYKIGSVVLFYKKMCFFQMIPYFSSYKIKIL